MELEGEFGVVNVARHARKVARHVAFVQVDKAVGTGTKSFIVERVDSPSDALLGGAGPDLEVAAVRRWGGQGASRKEGYIAYTRTEWLVRL